jgi:hypothetical protein
VSGARVPTHALESASPTVPEPASVRLELPASACCHAVGRLVVGGVGSRLALPVDRIEDLQLAVEALLSRTAARRVVDLELTESTEWLRVRVGPFAPAPAERGRVQEMLLRLVEDADVQDSDNGEWIVLGAARSRLPARRGA